MGRRLIPNNQLIERRFRAYQIKTENPELEWKHLAERMGVDIKGVKKDVQWAASAYDWINAKATEISSKHRIKYGSARELIIDLLTDFNVD